MDQTIINLYDEYTHRSLERHAFMNRLATIAGGQAAAEALLPRLESQPEHASIVDPSDERLETTVVMFTGGSGEVMAYSARLKGGEEKLPGVVVIHENRGLNDHIRDVARRAALEGFWTIAPDGLSPLGGTPDDEDESRDMNGQLDREKTRGDFVAAVSYLAGHDGCTGKVGCVGFCWGGGLANQLAVHAKDLDASVSFYGSQAAVEDVPKIGMPLMLHYGEKDERINASMEAYEAALKEVEKEYSIYVYEGANHAFHDDTSEARYDEAAAVLAWGRTIGFLEEKLD